VPAANALFHYKPKNSLCNLFESFYQRHAAFKTKYPWAVALLKLKPYLCLKKIILSSNTFMKLTGVESLRIFCEVGLQI
jgi:hypothetical protein